MIVDLLGVERLIRAGKNLKIRASPVWTFVENAGRSLSTNSPASIGLETDDPETKVEALLEAADSKD